MVRKSKTFRGVKRTADDVSTMVKIKDTTILERSLCTARAYRKLPPCLVILFATLPFVYEFVDHRSEWFKIIDPTGMSVTLYSFRRLSGSDSEVDSDHEASQRPPPTPEHSGYLGRLTTHQSPEIERLLPSLPFNLTRRSLCFHFESTFCKSKSLWGELRPFVFG